MHASSNHHLFLLLLLLLLQCCFTSTETVRTVTDGEPRSATSSLTQLLSSEVFVLLLLQCCFTSTETVRTVREGMPVQDVHLFFLFHTAPELSKTLFYFNSMSILFFTSFFFDYFPSLFWQQTRRLCVESACDDDEVMLNVLGCRLTY